MKKPIIASALLIVLAVSFASVGLGIGDSDMSQAQTVRNLTISEGAQAVLVRSDLKQGNVENHFGLLFNTAHGIVLRVAFNQEQEETGSENNTHFQMVVAYINLIEFNDTNHNGAFDKGVDSIVQRVPLWNWTYSTPTITTVTSTDGKQGYEIESHTTNAPFTFRVTADIFPQYALVGTTIVQPTSTKITTEIDNFPFKATGTLLSLQVIAISKTTVEQETQQLEETIHVRSSTADGFFKIDPTATVDGQTVQVKTSVNTFSAVPACLVLKRPSQVEDCLERAKRGIGPFAVISISFPQGSKIVHDPVLGIDITSPTPILTTTLLAIAAISAIAVFGLLVYAGRRQLSQVFAPTKSSIQ